MSTHRPTAEPATRLYEAILHLRRLGHRVEKCEGRRGRHRLDGAEIADAALLELAMTRVRRAARVAKVEKAVQAGRTAAGRVTATAALRP
ncbi:hypothetical protein VY88_25865 [Azospirillum thiophilum]|uniref:Uncharacterized protein n=1 Tax=Azospirillum thiophilum TaxID=528244 RepID=A0AAC8W4L3_9PROT|nr:hypothetical protein [Azospirillum thiophilum]ALG74988.1 hypothetical protein AL072_28785 [Azospirillum thiophilum]KJR62376.1 hypothetical protein VY88_25865 [Azospirillum thiophilum]